MTDDIRKQVEAAGAGLGCMQLKYFMQGYLAAMAKADVLVNAIDAIEGGLDDAYDLKNIAREALAEFRKGRDV